MNVQAYNVPESREINLRGLKMGGGKTLVIQSMANTDTNDVEASVKQSLQLADAGAQLIRFTTQGVREVNSLFEISKILKEHSCDQPLVADVHFRTEVAMKAARICEKVRINPGNFTETSNKKTTYTAEEYLVGFEKNKKQLLELINVCKENDCAIRIGVNHGSLSKRIMSRFGDTAEGMAESVMEFLRISDQANFHNIVVSLKSSNTRVMVQAVRLLTQQMIKENVYYPLHLGVTEAGNGLEGRIKSVIGIAALLQEGMGDTIRVSLTESPENELPVADLIRQLFPKPDSLPYNPFEHLPWDPFHYNKIIKDEFNGMGGELPTAVFAKEAGNTSQLPDFIQAPNGNIKQLIHPNFGKVHQDRKITDISSGAFINCTVADDPSTLAKAKDPGVVILNAGSVEFTHVKYWIIRYHLLSGNMPVVLRKKYKEKEKEQYLLKAAGEFGLLLIDGVLDGVWLENDHFSTEFNTWLSFNILQASRCRITANEFIACPSCGRTLFDIESVLEEVKSRTAHLRGLKIAVMGCIVNGPGEMADADYGYVGSGKGLVTLYKNQEAIMKNIACNEAVDKLIEIIKDNDDWIDP